MSSQVTKIVPQIAVQISLHRHAINRNRNKLFKRIRNRRMNKRSNKNRRQKEKY
jgi:hypothetical protein